MNSHPMKITRNHSLLVTGFFRKAASEVSREA